MFYQCFFLTALQDCDVYITNLTLFNCNCCFSAKSHSINIITTEFQKLCTSPKRNSVLLCIHKQSLISPISTALGNYQSTSGLCICLCLPFPIKRIMGLDLLSCFFSLNMFSRFMHMETVLLTALLSTDQCSIAGLGQMIYIQLPVVHAYLNCFHF